MIKMATEINVENAYNSEIYKKQLSIVKGIIVILLALTVGFSIYNDSTNYL